MESAAAATTTVANHDDQNQMSEYELSREQRIRENRERMGKLGIMDLSLKLKSSSVPPKRSYRSASTPKTPPTLRPSAPVRRSSRLQNVTPVSYSEVPAKKAEFEGNRRIVIEEGAKPEVYTEEHEKLLGYTEKSWTLFVDGCGKDGKRIYDSIKGKTCHQCRQKTLGYRTHCSNCKIVQGQFCGDCLYMRYGEHVLEALQNPTWLCPVCRGICNCSLCRQAKGWAPTGPMYKKIKALGYKSVAHYLVQTRRSGINEEKKADVSNPFLAKMSPPLSDVEINENLVEKKADVSNPVSAKRSPPLSDVEINENLVEKNADVSNPVSAKRSLPFSDVEINENLDIKENHLGLVKPPSKTESGGNEVSVKRSLLFSDDGQDPLVRVECLDTVKPLDSSPKPCSDSIARRLRPRLKKT